MSAPASVRQYEVVHRTTYVYKNDVSRSLHIARLAPRVRPLQRCLLHTLESTPAPAHQGTRVGYFGNTAAFLSIEAPHRQLTVTARSVVELTPSKPAVLSDSEPWDRVRDACRQAQPPLLPPAEFVYPSPLVPVSSPFQDYARPSFAPGRPVLEALVDLTHRIFSDFTFDPAATNMATPLLQVLKQRRGVCQDFAHFQLACLRSVGIPGRYVSGYLETQPAPGRAKLIGSDASHAWTQAWCGSLGWVDADPTNNLLPNDRHIALAWGRDYDDVCPLRGVITGGGQHQLKVGVDVVPLDTTGVAHGFRHGKSAKPVNGVVE